MLPAEDAMSRLDDLLESPAVRMLGFMVGTAGAFLLLTVSATIALVRSK